MGVANIKPCLFLRNFNPLYTADTFRDRLYERNSRELSSIIRGKNKKKVNKVNLD